jgi:hypothetical protein
MKMFKVTFSLLVLIVITACSRTNELANYDVRGSKIIIREHVAYEARTIQFEESTSGRTKKNSDESVSEVIEAIADIGSGILSSDAERKLQQAVDTESMVSYISASLAETFDTYLDMKIVESMNEDPAFIAEVTLQTCKLIISSSSMSIYAKANAEVFDRNTGSLVWENSESESIPLEDKTGTAINEKTVEKFLNAIKLNTLKPEEINEVLGNAVSEIGYEMGRTLRRDIAESNKE